MASVQLAPLPQSAVNRHCGADSPGVTHNPATHIVASPQVQQSAFDAHAVRQAPLMHMAPPPQSALARQAGRGRSSARHSPLSQRSSAPQPASLVHAAWHVPLIHVPPLAQSVFSTH